MHPIHLYTVKFKDKLFHLWSTPQLPGTAWRSTRVNWLTARNSLLISARHFGSWSCLAWPRLIKHLSRVARTRLYFLRWHTVSSASADDNVRSTCRLQRLGRCQFAVASRSVWVTRVGLWYHERCTVDSSWVKQIPEALMLQLCFSGWNWAVKTQRLGFEGTSKHRPFLSCWHYKWWMDGLYWLH